MSPQPDVSLVIPARHQPPLPLDRLILREPPAAEHVAMDVVFVGGGPAGLAGAIELARLGHEVTVFTAVAGFAWRTTIYSTLAARKRLRDMKVRIATLRAVKGFANGTLTVEDVSTGELERLAFDSLVAAQYNAADDRLFTPLRAAGLTVKAVGDCLTPRTALEAVYEGHAAARAL